MFSDAEDLKYSKKYALDPFFKFVGFVHRHMVRHPRYVFVN